LLGGSYSASQFICSDRLPSAKLMPRYRLPSVSVLVQACLLASIFAEKPSQATSPDAGHGNHHTGVSHEDVADSRAAYLNDGTPQDVVDSVFNGDGDVSTLDATTKVAIDGPDDIVSYFLHSNPSGSDTTPQPTAEKQKVPAEQSTSKREKKVIGGFHVPKQKVLAEEPTSKTAAQDATDSASDGNSDGELDSDSDDNSNAVLNSDSDDNSAGGNSDDRSGDNRIVTGDDAKHIKMQMDLQLGESEDMSKADAPTVALFDESHKRNQDEWRHHKSTQQVSNSDDNSGDKEIVVSPNAKHIEMQMGIKLGEHHKHHEKKKPHETAGKAHLLRRDD